MKKLFATTMLLSLLAVQGIHAMESIHPEQPVSIEPSDKPDQPDQTVHIPYKLISHSVTVRNMIEDIGGNLSDPIPFPNITKADWDKLIPFLELLDLELLLDEEKTQEIEQKLRNMELEELINLINVVSYLDIASILEPATDIAADKIKQSTQLVCNTTTIAQVEDGEKLCKDAVKITIHDPSVEKTIADKMLVITAKRHRVSANVYLNIRAEVNDKKAIQGDDVVVIRDKRDGRVIHQIPFTELNITKRQPSTHMLPQDVLNFEIDPTGKYLVIFKGEKTIEIWDIQSKPIKIHEGQINIPSYPLSGLIWISTGGKAIARFVIGESGPPTKYYLYTIAPAKVDTIIEALLALRKK